MDRERRILSLWLDRWAFDRFERVERGELRAELCAAGQEGAQNLSKSVAAHVLTQVGQGGVRSVAVNRPAGRAGLFRGQLLADAQALLPQLRADTWDEAGDAQALAQMARWCGRYTPWSCVDPDRRGPGLDGVWLDITGCGHLLGGEMALAQDIQNRLGAIGVSARIGVGPTPGIAWALARFGRASVERVDQKDVRQRLGVLPLAALRLVPDVVDSLARLGWKQVRDLYPVPRAPFVARFGRLPLVRVDQALGREAEAISPDLPQTALQVSLHFAEGLVRIEDIQTATGRLCEGLADLLVKEGQGARALLLQLHRSDGVVSDVEVGTSRPVGRADHLARLFHEKLDQLEGGLDTGYGIEVLRLFVRQHAPASAAQGDLHTQHGGGSLVQVQEQLGDLVDRLGNRIGAERVQRILPHASYLPEEATRHEPVLTAHQTSKNNAPIWPLEMYQRARRPLCLLPCAEPIEVVAEVPEGPPRQFRWRRVLYQVARSQGPERIGAEWWQRGKARAPTRDYFQVEDVKGHRFWLYRAGLYGRETTHPRWYVHGVFS